MDHVRINEEELSIKNQEVKPPKEEVEGTILEYLDTGDEEKKEKNLVEERSEKLHTIGPRRKYTDRDIKTALMRTGGVISDAAKLLGASYLTIWKRVRSNKELLQLQNLAEEYRIDLAESELMKAVKRGESWAVLFTLRTKGKKRGYTEGRNDSLHIEHGVNIKILPARKEENNIEDAEYVEVNKANSSE